MNFEKTLEEIKNRKSKITFEEKIKLLLNSKSSTENKAIIIEELSELQKEVTKDIRKKFNRDNFLEEMADVVIVLHMAKEIYNISESELDKVINKKMERNLSRIGIYRNPTAL